MKPFLKYPGRKDYLIPYLSKYWEPEYRLVDLFTGSLAVPLGLNPNKAICNDINQHIINLYNQVSSGLIFSFEPIYDRDIYYELRDEFNSEPPTSARSAELLITLNRMCFNGLYRTNSKGKFNVPFGSYSSVNFKTNFSEYAPILSNWQFVCGDFSNIEILPGDWIYSDSPYDCTFSNYSSQFNWNDQVRLIEYLSNKDCPILISNSATDRITDLYRDAGFQIELIEVNRSISAKSSSRGKKLEILARRGV